MLVYIKKTLHDENRSGWNLLLLLLLLFLLLLLLLFLSLSPFFLFPA